MKGILQSRLFFTAVTVLAFVLGGLTSYFLFPRTFEVSLPEVRDSSGNKLAFINPLLECADTNSTLPGDVRSLEENIGTYIQLQRTAGTVTDAGVYYRDLNNGPWFGIDEQKLFSPGSLLKVPLVIALYKQKEVASDYFDRKIEYTGGASTAEQDVHVNAPITPGHTYTVRELSEHMIKESDNNAALLLYQLLGYEATASTYRDLGLDPPSVGTDYQISVRTYATFFRLLFNATYLSKGDSNDALKLLSESDFKDGLVAGVPAGVAVSHKFGERHFQGEVSVEQLHDCGIIYEPKRPYILCVMTRGHDVKTLAPVIAQISKIVYTHIAE